MILLDFSVEIKLGESFSVISVFLGTVVILGFLRGDGIFL